MRVIALSSRSRVDSNYLTVTTLADIRLELAQQEKADATAGVAHEVTPSAFLTTGFDLEEQQCVLLISCLHLHRND